MRKKILFLGKLSLISIASLLVLLSLIVLYLQSSWGETWVRTSLEEVGTRYGIQLHIETIRNQFPLRYSLSNVTLEQEKMRLNIKSVSASLSPLALLRGKVSITLSLQNALLETPFLQDVPLPFSFSLTFTASRKTIQSLLLGQKPQKPLLIKGSIEGIFDSAVLGSSPFFTEAWSFSSPFILTADRSLQLPSIEVKNLFFLLKGKARTEADLFFQQAEGSLSVFDLSSFSSQLRGSGKGSLSLMQTKDGLLFQNQFSFPTLSMENTFILENVQGESVSSFSQGALQGSGKVSFSSFLESFSASASWTASEQIPLTFSKLLIQSPSLSLQGDLQLDHSFLNGKLFVHAEDLQHFFPQFPLQAASDWEINLFPQVNGETSLQNLTLQGHCTHFHFFSLSGEEASLSLAFSDIYHSPTSSFDLSGKQWQWDHWLLPTFEVHSSHVGPSNSFTLALSSLEPKKGNLQAKGSWSLQDDHILLSLLEVEGLIENYPFTLVQPALLQSSLHSFSLQNFHLQLGALASLQAEIELSPSKGTIQLFLLHIPWDTIPLPFKELDILGSFSAQIDLKTPAKDSWSGDLSLSFEDTTVHPLGTTQALPLLGQIQAQLKKNLCRTRSLLQLSQEGKVKIKSTFPFHLQFFPYALSFDWENAFSASLSFQGKGEDLLRFFDLGPHRIEGNLSCQIQLDSSLFHPNVKGYCELTDGSYENYYTGSRLHHLHASLTAQENVLSLDLTGEGTSGGTLSAQGKVTPDLHLDFPFSIQATFSQFPWVQLDLIEAYATGTLSIEGDLNGAKATGSATLSKTVLTIPNKVAVTVPEVPFTYQNGSEPLSCNSSPPVFYPLSFDLTIEAPPSLLIHGRGLNSEWQGSFTIQGTSFDPLIKGNLELIKGDFLFSGRPFTLNQGTVAFTGKSHTPPSIALSASTIQKQTTITAFLAGPLNSPSLSFQSTPPRPLSAILSLLVFGKDISEISGTEALQLASSITSLSDAPDVLEATRKTLGVDRLTITSRPSAAEGEPDKIALQIGKYITKEILVSFSQGLEIASSNLMVEVDLKRGLIFQAETQQQEEQGKFTLKWGHNY